MLEYDIYAVSSLWVTRGSPSDAFDLVPQYTREQGQ